MTARKRITIPASEVQVGDYLGPADPKAPVTNVAVRVHIHRENRERISYRPDHMVEVERPVPTVTVALPVDVAERFRTGDVTVEDLHAIRDALAGRDNPDSGQPVCDHCGQPVTRSAPNRPVWMHATGWHYGKDHHHAEVNGSMFMPEAQS